MKLAILALALLALLLAGCGGDFASPTHYEYDNHAVTTTTTTTTAAELAQENNRPVCVGLIILGSCNTTATQTQVIQPAAQASAASSLIPSLADAAYAFLIAGALIALFLTLLVGLRWIFGVSDDGTF